MQENEGKLLFEVRADQSDIKKDIEAIKNKQMIEIWKSLLAEISEEYIDIDNIDSFLDKLSS